MAEKMLYKVDEALTQLSIGRTRFYAECKAGRIRLVKAGKASLVPQSELDRYVRERLAEAAKAPA